MQKTFLFACLVLLCFFSTMWAKGKPTPVQKELRGKVYDCFMFYNELDLLEIRLNELYNAVDYFVLVESSETHRTGSPKPFYFEEAKERFAPFLNKIIHIKLTEHIETDNGWVRENWHRNQIMRGLTNCKNEDLILISDADEFITGETIPSLYRISAGHDMIGFWHQMYRWFLNRSPYGKWAGTAAIRYKHLVKTTPQEVRNRARSAQMTMWDGGWHFSSMGGYQTAAEKYYGIVEGYDTFLAYHSWREQVEQSHFVPIDKTFPKFVQDNIDYLIKLNLIDTITTDNS